MANPVKGEAALGEFTLAYNFGTFCILEEKTGQKVPELLQAMADGLGFGQLRDFVWAGLQAHHKGVSEESVVNLLDEQGYEAAGIALGKAINGYFGEQKAKGKNPRKAAA